MADKKRVKVKGTIISVTPINSGINQKTGNPWTLYEVLIGDQIYRTFDKGYIEFVGKENEWEYDEENRVSPKGKPYISRTLISLRREMDGVALVLAELKKMDEKLDKIVDFFIKNNLEDELDEPEYFVSPPDDVPF